MIRVNSDVIVRDKISAYNCYGGIVREIHYGNIAVVDIPSVSNGTIMIVCKLNELELIKSYNGEV